MEARQVSGDFLSQADLWAWVYELTKVKPGDFGSLNDNDDAAIRALNHEWSIRLPWADIPGVEI